MVNIKKYIEEWKIRASYGEVGNQSGIGLYDGVQLYNFNTASGAYIGDGKVSYIAAAKELVTTNRTWERIKNYNVGFDFTVLNSRYEEKRQYVDRVAVSRHLGWQCSGK